MSDHHEALPAFNHPVSVKLLLGVFFFLIALTILTVVASNAGLPEGLGFPVAMLFASLKAFLVGAFFMHMWWDKGINLATFFVAFLFLALFLGLVAIDSHENQNSIDQFPRKPDAPIEAPSEG